MTRAVVKGVVDFIVYGSFVDPTTGVNFIVIRMPAGRVPWQKKIIPAVRRLVKPWTDVGEELRLDVDGDPKPEEHSLWNNSRSRRYEWRSNALVEVTR